MINEQAFRLKKNGEPSSTCYCRHPELIENYDKAIADNSQTWEVHHRKEEFYSYKELVERGEYFDVSPEDLIFLTKEEHNKIDSHCKRNSEANKGKKRGPFSEEHRRKLSEAHKGPKNHMFGKKHSAETKRKISETCSKKVLCVETGKVFESTVDAYRETGIYNGNISAACRGKQKTAGKFHWKFVQ